MRHTYGAMEKQHNDSVAGTKTPIHEDGRSERAQRPLDARWLGCGADAACAPFDAHGLAGFHQRDGLQIRVEAAARVAVRKADCVSEGRTFAAIVALRHVKPPKQTISYMQQQSSRTHIGTLLLYTV